LVMFFASGFLALLPSLARTVNTSPTTYGLLLGCFGLGAVLGALLMQQARRRWSSEVVIASGVVIFGITTLGVSMVRSVAPLAGLMLVAGSAWIVFISILNVLVLNHTPDWIRARALAIATLVFQGAVALGSATWGNVAQRFGIGAALLIA